MQPSAPGLVLHGTHDFFATDPIGHIYLVKGAELVKYNAAGKRMARYSDLRLGDISSVDATNPLKILLHYRDYQQVVFLDNQLSPNGKPIALELLGLEQAHLVCASANNSFWVYDRRNSELHRFDENQQRITSTGNLRQVLSTDVAPVSMIEHNNYLYLNCPGAGIYVFDVFGSFSRLLALPGAEAVQVSGDIVYTRRSGRLCSFDQRKLDEVCDSLWHPRIRQAVVDNKKRYFSFRDSLVVYPL